eukprot:GHVP01019257.1.p1 GENE.GHVP01019257.1~~GHVP01019257.1.p1  ORF type:complete len:111 (+),score=10.90 GHVP01019257.1:149-481(+)
MTENDIDRYQRRINAHYKWKKVHRKTLVAELVKFNSHSEETLNKEQSIFDKAVFKQSKFMHNHLVAREVGCDYLIKAEHAIRIMNFARLMYRNKNCSEMKEATDLMFNTL